jgi:hypothetical protein
MTSLTHDKVRLRWLISITGLWHLKVQKAVPKEAS